MTVKYSDFSLWHPISSFDFFFGDKSMENKKPPEGGLVRIASLLWLDPLVPTVNQNILNFKYICVTDYILTASRKARLFLKKYSHHENLIL